MLNLLNEKYEEFKSAVASDKDLQYKFHRITHLPQGQFFTTKHAAIGYFKEDVFYSKKRTNRVFRIINDYYRDFDGRWDRQPQSESDECLNQSQDSGQYNSSDSEEEQKKPLRGKSRKKPAPQIRYDITQQQYFKLLDENKEENKKKIKEIEQTHEKKLKEKEEVIK